MKIIRKIFLICGILLVLIIAVLSALFFIFTNSDHLKNQITQQVYAQTGLKLQIKGRVSWTAAEELGLRFTDVELKQIIDGDIWSSAKSPQVDVFIAWRPLLSRQIKIQKLNCHPCSFSFRENFSQKQENVTVKGDLQLDLPTQHLNMEHLTIDSGDIHAQGKISGDKIMQSPELKGEIKIAHLNLAKGLPFFSGATDSQNYLKNALIHFRFFRKEGMSGDISGEELVIDRFHVSRLTAQFTGNALQMQFRNIHGKLAGGALTGSVAIMNWLSLPQYQINAALTHAEISKLLESDILRGPADISTHLSLISAGKTATLSNLNGNVQLTMSAGILNHIDLLKQIRAVRDFLHANPHVVSADVTHFSRLTASGVISNGAFTNNDFILQSPDLQATGHGAINLVNQQLKYNLMVKAQGKIAKESYGLSAPLNITGTLAKPKVKIDLNEMSVSFGKTLHNEIKILFGHHHLTKEVIPLN